MILKVTKTFEPSMEKTDSLFNNLESKEFYTIFYNMTQK